MTLLYCVNYSCIQKTWIQQFHFIALYGYLVLLFDFQGLHLSEIIVESEKRGITFDKLLTVPENDSWVYEDGRSASCIAFVLMMYKEAGLFDPITSSVEVTEFTVSAPESLCSSLWPYIGTFVRAKGSGGDICFVNASISFSSAQWNAGLSFC